MKKNRSQEQGFTLIELLMVVLVIGILAAIGVTQFVDFARDSRNATLKANLQVLRRAISAQNGMMRLRCGVINASFPPLANLSVNSITDSNTPCTTAQVSAPDNVFVSGGIPDNPWSPAGTTANAIISCPSAPATTGPAVGGWCYDENTGTIWANTEQNNGDGTGDENTY